MPDSIFAGERSSAIPKRRPREISRELRQGIQDRRIQILANAASRKDLISPAVFRDQRQSPLQRLRRSAALERLATDLNRSGRRVKAEYRLGDLRSTGSHQTAES